MTLRPALDRLARGAHRLYWEWPRRLILRRPASTPGQRDQARETEVSLGLMASAQAAGAESTPEQQIFLSQSEHGMRERLSVLLGIPHRSLDQEREKLAIEGWLSRGQPELAQPSPSQSGLRRFAAVPALGALGMVRPWMLWGGALAAVALWGGYNDVRAGHAENQLDAAKANLAAAQRALAATTTERDLLTNAVAAADAQTRQTAATIEAERARRVRAEADARRIRNEIERARAGAPTIDYGFGSLRDTGPGGSPDAGGGNAAGRNPG